MRILLPILFILLLASCGDRPECKNTDPVFDQYQVTDQPYKDELVTRIQHTDPAKMHFWIDKYKEVNGKPFMSVNVQSDSLCAQMMIDIKNPNKLKHFKNVKGISYTGAEIKGLQYHTDTVNGIYNFIFEEGKIKD